MTADELFARVLESMNAGRDTPIPESEHPFIRALSEEALRYRADFELLARDGEDA